MLELIYSHIDKTMPSVRACFGHCDFRLLNCEEIDNLICLYVGKRTAGLSLYSNETSTAIPAHANNWRKVYVITIYRNNENLPSRLINHSEFLQSRKTHT